MPGEDSAIKTQTTTDVEAEITRGIVGIYASLYGRGPVTAHTHVSSSYALTVLGEAFTTAERTLLAAGQVEQVERTRRAFQEAVRKEFISVAERATGRTVSAFMSQIDAPTETAVELFLFETPAGDGADAWSGS